MEYFAIGDIHGEISKLRKIFDKIKSIRNKKNIKKYKIILLWDFIDRWENSKQVLEFIKEIYNENIILLLGNHEDFLIEYSKEIDNYSKFGIWCRNWWLKCLKDFGINVPKLTFNEFKKEFVNSDLFKIYIPFLEENCKLYYETDGHFFVHAGLSENFNTKNIKRFFKDEKWLKYTKSIILEVRDSYLKSAKFFGKKIISWHTPVPILCDYLPHVAFNTKEIYESPYRNFILIDTWAFMWESYPLSCIRIFNDEKEFEVIYSH